MTIRTARGGSPVRWAYGVFIALCAALAVLVHHETTAMGASPVMDALSMPMTHTSSMADAAHAGHVMPDKGMQTVREPSSPNTTDTGGCATPGMQHCAAASVDSVQLAVPEKNEFSPFADLREGTGERPPAAVVGRAPPDLSVLSQLRI